MLIERPPKLFRILFPGAVFRMPERRRKRVYLTFDDGPVPEATPLVLSILRRFGVKATFFMVGQNVERHPELLEMVRKEGHAVGCHTMHHLRGDSVTTMRYLLDVRRCSDLIGTRLFRPPHGRMRPRQLIGVRRDHAVVMFDLVTRDYSRLLTPFEVFENVRRYARPGSIIVFHDSLKSLPRMPEALEASLEWLISQGYSFGTLELLAPPIHT